MNSVRIIVSPTTAAISHIKHASDAIDCNCGCARGRDKRDIMSYVCNSTDHQIYQGADKSLARPGRKRATATKFWLFQATQKQFRGLSFQPGLRGSNDIRIGRKMATFLRVGLRTYQHPCILTWQGFRALAVELKFHPCVLHLIGASLVTS